MSDDTSKISSLLQSYRDGLVASSTSKIIKLYHPNALLLAQGFPIVSGTNEIENWYDSCFENITLDVTFDIKEVIVFNEEYAVATTTSEGTQKVNKTGQVTQEGNHELFMIQKDKGEWKIARYCFSTVK